MGYPAGMPTWEQQELDSLASQNKLFGVNPLVLAGVAQNESGFEVKGAGINSIGDGGFFGLNDNSTYSYEGSSFQTSSAELLTPGLGTFDQQAEAAASAIARLSAGRGLQAGLASYTGGGLNNGDYIDAMSALGAAPPLNSSTTSPITSTASGGTPTAGTAAPATATTAGLTSSILGDLFGSVLPKNAMVRLLLIIVGLIILAVGVDKLFDPSAAPTDIVVNTPQAVQNGSQRVNRAAAGKSGGQRSMQAPGADRGMRGRAQHAAPKHHPLRKGAEDSAKMVVAE